MFNERFHSIKNTGIFNTTILIGNPVVEGLILNSTYLLRVPRQKCDNLTVRCVIPTAYIFNIILYCCFVIIQDLNTKYNSLNILMSFLGYKE